MDKMMLKKQYMMYSPKKSSSRLPSEYQEVEYIEGNGNQWIDTNYVPTIDDVIETDIEITTLVSHKSWWTTVFGSYPTKSLWIYKSSLEDDSYFSTYSSGSGGSDGNKFMQVSANVPYNIIFNKSTIIVNGTSYSIANGTGTSQDALSLFRVNPYTQSQYQVFIGKIKGFKITNNNTTKLDLVPCYRKSDNEIGMYDLVTNTFYTNQGSGSFIAGRAIVNIDGYQQVDYIESTGTQYIETNIKYNSDNKYVFEFEMNTFQTTDGDVSFGWDYGGQVNVQPSKFDNGMNITSFNSLEKTKFIQTIKAGKSTDSIIRATNSSETKTIARKHASLSGGASTYGYGIIVRFGIDGLSGFGAGRLYSFKCSINGVLTNYLIPCYRKSDNEVGLYDIVGKQFYTNSGSGTFLKGANV